MSRKLDHLWDKLDLALSGYASALTGRGHTNLALHGVYRFRTLGGYVGVVGRSALVDEPTYVALVLWQNCRLDEYRLTVDNISMAAAKWPRPATYGLPPEVDVIHHAVCALPADHPLREARPKFLCPLSKFALE